MNSSPRQIPRFLKDVQNANPQTLQGKFRKLESEDNERSKHANDKDSRFSLTIASSKAAGPFNRYMDIMPYNHSRVKLSSGKTDYINASYLDAPGKIRRYIAAQGPLSKTIDDFWLMVWEQNCGVVVMLTQEREKNLPKCTRYWPEKDKSFNFDDIGMTVTLESEVLDPSISSVMRSITLTRKDDDNSGQPSKTRRITQLHFMGWSDHGVPDSPDALLLLISKTNELQQLHADENNARTPPDAVGPVVVHCSAGVGRTGTFCTVDSVMALLPAMDDDSMDLVFHIIGFFREQRMRMVQTLRQYQFCYLTLLRKFMLDGIHE
ncbi:4664_t:CDS:1 [Paraglomus brasilianum]|uniref:4664_t:CDS:1 n=1 Tax=Paraglomus brasilianum TaxID=144538 RepID=A0A9N9FIJ2_9GLOM|nr:4664_t:CDS:1 [Paraglomus brasilianum]